MFKTVNNKSSRVPVVADPTYLFQLQLGSGMNCLDFFALMIPKPGRRADPG
jgi:hypothetical protein